MSTRSRIERVRIRMAIGGGMLCVLPLVGLLEASGRPIDRATSIVAGLAVVAVIGLAQTGPRRLQLALVPVTGVLAVLAGTSLDDPLAVSAFCVGAVLAQTMQGSRLSVLLRLVCLLPVVPLTVLFSTSPLLASSPVDPKAAVAATLLVPNFTGLIYLLRRALEGQAATIARERFSATLSGRLLAATTVDEVVAAMTSSNDELLGLSPGLITLEASRIAPGDPDGGGARVLNSHGDLAGRPPELIPAQALRELPDFDTEELLLPLQTGSSNLTELGLPQRKWHAVALEQQQGAPVDLVLYGVRAGLVRKLFGLSPEEVEFLTNLRIMQAHWRSAMARVQACADLIDARERDDVTGLPDQSATMRKVVEYVHAGTSRTALILLELSGLDRVEAEQGLAAADSAMQQLAHRITGILDGAGHVGRSGDASFTVLLPDAESHDEIESLVEQLEDAILEPVMLPDGATRLSLNLGLSRTTEGGTAADLLERAVSMAGVAGGSDHDGG